MSENVQRVFFNSKENSHSGLVWHCTHQQCDAVLFDYIKSQCNNTLPVVVIDAAAVLPPHAIKRLVQPFTDFDKINRTTALTTLNYALSPLVGNSEFLGDNVQMDHSIFLLQKASVFISKELNPAVFAVRNVDFLEQESDIYVVSNLLVDPPLSSPIKGTDLPITGDQRPLPAHPLAELQLKLAQYNKALAPLEYPGINGKPNLLHVLMDWGGGVHQWVEDFINTADDFNHFMLVSEGEFFRHQHGEKLKLYWHSNKDLAIEESHLSKPIKSTVKSHPEYLVSLQRIIENHGIQAVVVSSLIGHSMDCLATGLPTIRVLHDYFPHWPSLNAQLDAPKITDTDISQALKQTQNEPFGEIRLSEWQLLQQANNELLSESHVQIVAPNQSVVDNLLKLENSACFEKTRVIPHGMSALEKADFVPDSQSFKLLVLGRISLPKGQDLLKATIQALKDQTQFEFVLLGAGKVGAEFKDIPQVTVIPEYHHKQLPALIKDISPNLALLTSVTSETFSYTLSELQMLGVPVLSTAVGALKNRITDKQDGFLVQPDVNHVVKALVHLQDHRELLTTVSKNALSKAFTTTEQMVNNYLQIWSENKWPTARYQVKEIIRPNILAQKLQDKNQTIERLQAQQDALQENLEEKVKWAKELKQHIGHLEQNIDNERAENVHLLNTLKQAQQRHLQEANSLKDTLTEIKNHLDQLNQEKAATEKTLTEKEQTLQAREQELEAVYNSRSWRATRPLRTFTTWARHKRNAIKFRCNQLLGLPKRVNNSIKTRGIKDTAKIAANKLKKGSKPVTPVKVHEIKEQYQPLTIATAAQPKVSIIIPVYNQYKHTYHCLESLARLTDKTSFEVIVVNDCSTDDTAELLKDITGITAHTQPQNGGFIESCNTGAKLAKGEYLLFLNNDTEVLPEWLDSLVATFEQNTDAGLVGSQLIYPDGRLQEAGGIVFSDASGWNYGRFDSPDYPEYQHVREVSYCSGASILIKQSLFDELGQFDQRYKPAYYEDTDLAFAVRQKGLKVYYQPLSKIIHFEGISSGTDLSSGTKKYQVINQQKFLEKWQQALSHQPKAGSLIEQARFQNQPKRVLILDACTPTPDQDSGSLRMLNMMQIFIDLGYQVSFIPENMAHFEQYTSDLQQLGVECVYAPKYHTPIEYLKAKGEVFDLVILSRYYVAKPVLSAIKSYCPKAQTWFDTVDLHYLREQRMAEVAGDEAMIKSAAKTKQHELEVAAACDLTLVVSPYEQSVLAEEMPALKVDVLSNIHEVYGNQKPFDERQDLMFIGGYQHTPNVDGILWFVEASFPLIVQSLPEVTLHIVGSKAPKQVSELGQHPNIKFHGFVEDIEPFMQDIRIAVAPLRFGAGVKGKVNMSMSYGQPVVGTKVAVEGMYTTHEQDVMMADDPAEFAAAVIRLYQDETLWNQISAGGLENVEQWFSFNAAKTQIKKLISK